MNTPMMELKDKFMEAGTLADWMDDAFDEAIEKEKQMVIDSNTDGYDQGIKKMLRKDTTTAEDYYNQKYKS